MAAVQSQNELSAIAVLVLLGLEIDRERVLLLELAVLQSPLLSAVLRFRSLALALVLAVRVMFVDGIAVASGHYLKISA